MDDTPKFYSEKDRNLATFLLACGEVIFCGTKKNDQTIYFLFEPKERAVKLINLYFSKKEPHIPAKTLLETVDNYKTILFKAKEEISASFPIQGRSI